MLLSYAYFEIKNIGEDNYVIGIKTDMFKRILSLSCKAYTERVLERFKMIECKANGTPIFFKK